MGRDRGTFVMPGNTELKQEAPYDARLVVNDYEDLTKPETWKDENGRVWLYDGMLVSVTSGLKAGEVYMLADKNRYTDTAFWYPVGAPDYSTVSRDTTGRLQVRVAPPTEYWSDETGGYKKQYQFLSESLGGLRFNVGTNAKYSLVYANDKGLTFDVGNGLKIGVAGNGVTRRLELTATELILATHSCPVFINDYGFFSINLGSGLYVDKTRLSLGTAGMLCLDTNIRESSGGSGSLLLTTITSPIYADNNKYLRLSVGTGLSIKPSVDIYPAAIQLDVDDLNRRMSELELTTRTSSVYKDGDGFLRLRLSSGLEEYMDDPYGDTYLRPKLAEDSALYFEDDGGLHVKTGKGVTYSYGAICLNLGQGVALNTEDELTLNIGGEFYFDRAGKLSISTDFVLSHIVTDKHMTTANGMLELKMNEVQKSLVLATGLAKDDVNALYVNPQNALQLSTSLEWKNGLLSVAELAKRQIFDDMWNIAVGSHGRVDHNHTENGVDAPYQLYSLWLTYKEALAVYNAGEIHPADAESFFRSRNIRTHLPSMIRYTIAVGNYTFYECTSIERVELVNLKPGYSTFFNCKSLRYIKAHSPISDTTTSSMTYTGCVSLESLSFYAKTYVKSFSVADSPLLGLSSFQEIVEKKVDDGAMTITVHPDVYNKLVDENNAEWHQVYTDAAAKEISFATKN